MGVVAPGGKKCLMLGNFFYRSTDRNQRVNMNQKFEKDNAASSEGQEK